MGVTIVLSRQIDFISILSYSLLALVSLIRGTEITDPSQCKSYPCLLFHDDFDKLDHATWDHLITRHATGNQEFQYYTNNRSNSFIRDGKLYLKPTLTNDTYNLTSGVLDLWGSSAATHCTSNRHNEGCYAKGSPENILNPIQSAAIRTEKSFSFKFGRLEVRAQMPRGDWIWPSVWLMPRYNVYGGWPSSGEIDLFESRGNDELSSANNNDVGNKMISQSLHWGPYYPEDGHAKTLIHMVKKTGSYSDDFHLFGMEWTPETFSFSIDNHTTLNVTVSNKSFWEMGDFAKISKDLNNPWEMGSNMAPFDEEFYIIMNVAIGGTNNYFHDTFVPRPPWKNDDDGKTAMKDFWEAREKWLKTWKGDQTALKVDYVKVWKLEEHS